MSAKKKKHAAENEKLLEAIAAEGKAAFVTLDVAVCSACGKKSLQVLGELGKPGDVKLQYVCKRCGSTAAPRET